MNNKIKKEKTKRKKLQLL